jgi:hypothetical protein
LIITLSSASAGSKSAAALESDQMIDSFSVTLKPELQSTPLPSWMSKPLYLSLESSSVEIALSALSGETTFDHFVLTVVFNDHGDGGPLVQWKSKNGDLQILCSGLGVNGPPIGLNARKLLIPERLAFEGGTLVISHAGRFDQIVSIKVETAHQATIAIVGEKSDTALIDEAENTISKDLIDGTPPPLKEGDVMNGHLMTAELSAKTQQATGEFEFIASSDGKSPEAIMLYTELAGLDLESQIEVSVNDHVVGMLQTAPFSLKASEMIKTANLKATEKSESSFQLAGWRKAWIYVPARYWQQGENHMILRAITPQPSPISLRNSRLNLRYDADVWLGNSTTPLAKNLFRY